MSSTYTTDLRSILIFGGFTAVIPLVFYPQDWGVSLAWSFWLLAGLELCIYFLWWWLAVPKERLSETLVMVCKTAALRWGCAIMFGVLLLFLGKANLKVGIADGLYHYFPAIIIQVLASPLILQFIGPGGRVSRRPAMFSHPTMAGDWSETRSSHRTSDGETGIFGLTEVLGYIKDYSGVEACLLVDSDGLTLAHIGNFSTEAEDFAPVANLLEQASLKVLNRIGQKKLERADFYTDSLRLAIVNVLDYRLLVVCDRKTDDLINIRIQRVVEQLSKILTEKYPQEVLKESREEAHVRNS